MPTPVTTQQALDAWHKIDSALAVAEIRMSLPAAQKLLEAHSVLSDFLAQAAKAAAPEQPPAPAVMP
jgi:hypothetical protein